ncbi:hypothetical protein SAMN05444166_0165 [Singulisphaera sp. GP187]|nr:hypothetical protein SAMN05444166_0165 [Singulisphaera sp. GP187]
MGPSSKNLLTVADLTDRQLGDYLDLKPDGIRQIVLCLMLGEMVSEKLGPYRQLLSQPIQG